MRRLLLFNRSVRRRYVTTKYRRFALGLPRKSAAAMFLDDRVVPPVRDLASDLGPQMRLETRVLID